MIANNIDTRIHNQQVYITNIYRTTYYISSLFLLIKIPISLFIATIFAAKARPVCDNIDVFDIANLIESNTP